MYVSATGLFEVFKGENAILKKFGVGEAFGELAILYGAPRLASIKGELIEYFKYFDICLQYTFI